MNDQNTVLKEIRQGHAGYTIYHDGVMIGFLGFTNPETREILKQAMLSKGYVETPEVVEKVVKRSGKVVYKK